MDFVDKQLAKKAKLGDKKAFEDLVDQYKEKIYRLAYRMLGNKEEAEDISQDTFLKVYSYLDRYDEEHKFSTWIYRIATNLSIDRLRKKKADYFLDDHRDQPEGMDWYTRLPHPDNGPEDEVIITEREQMVQQALLQLPDKYRSIMVLRYMQDLSIQEISDVTGVSNATVKTRLHRGREILRKLLIQTENEGGND